MPSCYESPSRSPAGVREADDLGFRAEPARILEWIDPQRFDPAQVLEGFAVWQRYLDTIAELARDAPAGVFATMT